MTEIFRIALQVDDIPAAAAFYSKLLGTKGKPVHTTRHYFDCGPVLLALVNPAEERRRARPIPDHLYFSTGEIARVHTRARRLGCLSKEKVHGEAGGEVVRRPWGERSFYAIDPWGNRLCFVDSKTLYRGGLVERGVERGA